MTRKATIPRAAPEPAADPMRKTQYVLRASHVLALRREAYSRAAQRVTGGPDASEVLREVIDAWLAKGSGGKR